MKRIILICVAVMIFASIAGAQLKGGIINFFMQDDKNKDGKVSKEEFSGNAALFVRFDENGDNVISQEEITSEGHRLAGPWVPEGMELLRDVVYGSGGDVALKMDILRPKETPKKPMPVVVWIHGGAWRAGSKDGIVQRFSRYVERGYLGVSISYRLTDVAPFPAQVEDCKCAIRYLRAHAEKYNLDPKRIGIWGSSAGGHLVAFLGVAGDQKQFDGKGGWADQSSAVQAVCDFFGPSNLVAMAGQPSGMNHENAQSPEGQLVGGSIMENKEKAMAASPVTYATKDDPPFLIMHGTKDNTVPFDQSELMTKALRKAGADVEFVPVIDAGHGGPQFREAEVAKKVAAFFDKHLKRGKTK